MTDTLSRPASEPSAPVASPDAPDAAAERWLETPSPQRPQVTPTFTVEVDGRQYTGREGQTILEICRDNGIDVPTLCYEPKLPGFGACRMCVVEVEGENQPPISCSRTAEPDMVVRTQTPRLRRRVGIAGKVQQQEGGNALVPRDVRHRREIDVLLRVVLGAPHVEAVEREQGQRVVPGQGALLGFCQWQRLGRQMKARQSSRRRRSIPGSARWVSSTRRRCRR